MSISLIENAYNINNVEHTYISGNNEQLNSFVNFDPGQYPPRMDFEICTHNLKKNDVYILKFDDGGRASFAVNNKEVKIIDIFLKDDFQGQSILKKIVNSIRACILTDHPTVEFITLNSLHTGIVLYKFSVKFPESLE